MDKKQCLDCGTTFTGRADKKFCSAYCRTNYYNRHNSDQNNHMRKVNGILRKNRRILLEQNTSGKTKVAKKTLLKEGFSFEYFTNVYTNKKGLQYYFVYEQGYLQLGDEWLMLVEQNFSN